MEKHEQSQSINRLSKNLLELLESKGYSPGSLKNYQLLLSRINVFMNRIKIDKYTENIGELFTAAYFKNRTYSITYQQQIRTKLRRLNELNNGIDYSLLKQTTDVALPFQFSELLETYVRFCTSIGNKKNSISKKRKFCLEFIRHITDAGCNNIYDINTKYIGKAILQLNNKDSYAVIRSFLKHLYETGNLKIDFSGIVPKYRRAFVLPTTYSDDEIRRLENAIDRTTNKGNRDYAIFLLASRLGMRCGDIVGMTLDNIDFNRSCIVFVQNKTCQSLSLPLLPEIRQAIMEYIEYARPDVKNNYLFIKTKAPFDKISTSAIRHTLTECFKSARIDISNKKHGPHTLRSSMASSMVNSDVSYEIVKKILGHVDPQAIKHYAKVDIENLRLHAINVPTPTGIFAMILQGRK